MSATETEKDDDEEEPTTTDDADVSKASIEAAWTELFATVWRDVEWSSYDRAKTSRTEVFGEKLLSAAKKGTPEETIDELCRRFGLAASTLSTEAFETLRADRSKAISVLRRNRVYLAAETRRTIDAYYDALNETDRSAESSDQTTDLSDFVEIETTDSSATEANE